MDKNWTKVFSTPDVYLAEILKGSLDEHGIECIIINKRDSVYNNFGEIELFVQKDYVLRAINIIERQNQ